MKPAMKIVSRRLFDVRDKTGQFPFKYTRSEHTNVAATIERVKRELASGERKL